MKSAIGLIALSVIFVVSTVYGGERTTKPTPHDTSKQDVCNAMETIDATTIILMASNTNSDEGADQGGNGKPDKETHEEVARLIKLLDHPNKKMQYVAAMELGQLGDEAEAAIPKLNQKIFDFLSISTDKYEDLATARAAAQSLGRIGIQEPKTIELLQSLAEWAKEKEPQTFRICNEALDALKE